MTELKGEINPAIGIGYFTLFLATEKKSDKNISETRCIAILSTSTT